MDRHFALITTTASAADRSTFIAVLQASSEFPQISLTPGSSFSKVIHLPQPSRSLQHQRTAFCITIIRLWLVARLISAQFTLVNVGQWMLTAPTLCPSCGHPPSVELPLCPGPGQGPPSSKNDNAYARLPLWDGQKASSHKTINKNRTRL